MTYFFHFFPKAPIRVSGIYARIVTKKPQRKRSNPAGKTTPQEGGFIFAHTRDSPPPTESTLGAPTSPDFAQRGSSNRQRKTPAEARVLPTRIIMK